MNCKRWLTQVTGPADEGLLRLAKTSKQQQVLKDLVGAYPGFLVAGGGTGTNPVHGRAGVHRANGRPVLPPGATVSRPIRRHAEDDAG